MNFGDKLLHGLLEGWWMFFDTFWALIFGFVLSGAIQAFISRGQMKRSLGDHSPQSIAKASFFGVVSSSCSYAASALAKSIFTKGADFTASMVFMFASTNLVVELGFVLWILIGWQFALAEFIGGAIMITLLTLLTPRVISRTLISAARGSTDLNVESLDADNRLPFTQRLRQKSQWRAAAGYTIGDFTMMRWELLLGFLIAGLISFLVPADIWNALFLHGHGFIATCENALIAPLIAIISFVCSVGNVPLAAALWKSGISFGGTISFIFADLISLPLILIYIKYYGRNLTIRLVALFWLVMSLSGLLTQGLFQLLGLTPRRMAHSMSMSMSMSIGSEHWGANLTTTLDAIALALFLAVLILHLKRGEKSLEYAQDPVCGMQVRIIDAPAHCTSEGEDYYFCMPGCLESFLKNPKQYLKS